MARKTVLISVFLLICLALNSAGDDIKVSSHADWKDGVVRLEFVVPLDISDTPFARARLAAEQQVQNRMTRLLIEAAGPLTIDSQKSVGEFLNEKSDSNDSRLYLEALTNLSGFGIKKTSLVAADYKSLLITYEFPFFGPNGIATPLIRHRKALPLPVVVGYRPAKKFSGIVIYVQGDYEAFGREARTALSPAFFPRIFYLSRSGTIEPFFQMQMADPAALKRWGMLTYVAETDTSLSFARVGNFPLEVTAFQIYGIKNTDIIISEEAAMMILANKDNRELLRDGKIVVIIDKTDY